MRWIGPALLALVLAAAGLSVFQGRRTFNMVDGAFLLENLHRIRCGELPYRDFWLNLGPVHYLVHAVVLTLAQDRAAGLLIGGALEQGLMVMLTFAVCRELGEAPRASLVWAAFPVVGGIGVMGFPLYDIDAGLLGLLTLWSLLRWETRSYATGWGLLAGGSAALVALTKFNIGLPLLAGLAVVVAGARLLDPRFPVRRAAALALGAAVPLLALAAVLFALGCWDDFMVQTILEPRRLRLTDPVGKLMDSLSMNEAWLAVLLAPLKHTHLWRILLCSYFLFASIGWSIGAHQPPVRRLSPIPVLALVLGAFQSQVFASTYGVYGLAGVMLCGLHRFAVRLGRGSAATSALILAALFLASGLYEIRMGNRLTAFLVRPFLDRAPIQAPRMRGLFVTRDVRDAFDELVRLTEDVIPQSEPVFFIPGDMPFYFATGRRCPLKNFQVEVETGLSLDAAMAALDRLGVPWLVVRLVPGQGTRSPALSTVAALNRWIERNHDPVRQTARFAIWKRKR